MNIIQDFIPVGRKNRPGRKIIGTNYITVHDTGNPKNGAYALNHAKYLKGDSAANAPVSWHFTVDDKNTVQHLPLTEHGYHAGDGHGPGNMSSIGIEICENADGDRGKAEENAAQLVAKLLRELGLPLSAVVQHNRWSGKNCPRIIRSRPGGWEGFLRKIEDNLNREEEYEMTKEDANKIIRFLSAGWFVVQGNKEAEAEFNRLANELRKASGQEEQ